MAQYSSPSNLVSNVAFILDLPVDHEDRADPQEETSLQLVNSEQESQVGKVGSCEQVFGGSSSWLAVVLEPVFTSSDPGLDRDRDTAATKTKRRNPIPHLEVQPAVPFQLEAFKTAPYEGKGQKILLNLVLPMILWVVGSPESIFKELQFEEEGFRHLMLAENSPNREKLCASVFLDVIGNESTRERVGSWDIILAAVQNLSGDEEFTRNIESNIRMFEDRPISEDSHEANAKVK